MGDPSPALIRAPDAGAAAVMRRREIMVTNEPPSVLFDTKHTLGRQLMKLPRRRKSNGLNKTTPARLLHAPNRAA